MIIIAVIDFLGGGRFTFSTKTWPGCRQTEILEDVGFVWCSVTECKLHHR